MTTPGDHVLELNPSTPPDSHDNIKSLPQATAILSFFQLISGVVGLSISQNLFIGGLKTQLKPYNLPSDIILAITGSVEVSCDPLPPFLTQS